MNHTGQRKQYLPILLVLALSLPQIPGFARAHDDVKPAVPVMTVTGTGNVAIAPDMAYVTFGMQTVGRLLAEAQRQNSNVMQKVIDRLAELHIERTRIQTSAFSVSPQYKPPPTRHADAPPMPPEIIGYLVSNQLTVRSLIRRRSAQ